MTEGTWRTPLLYRLFFPTVGLYFLWATVAYFDGGSDIGFTALSFALGVALTVGPFIPVVKLEGDIVYARGLIFHRRIPLAQVTDVVPGYSGLDIQSCDGRSFEATGVGEKGNIAAWVGRRTRADDVAEVILRAAQRARLENDQAGHRSDVTS